LNERVLVILQDWSAVCQKWKTCVSSLIIKGNTHTWTELLTCPNRMFQFFSQVFQLLKLFLTYMWLMDLRYILSITFLLLFQELLEFSFSLLHLKPSFLLFLGTLIKLASIVRDPCLRFVWWWVQMSEFRLVLFLHFLEHFVVLMRMF
jgi:hypothetical protein